MTKTFSPPYKDNSLGPLKKAFSEKLIWTWKCDYFKNNRSKYIPLLQETDCSTAYVKRMTLTSYHKQTSW